MNCRWYRPSRAENAASWLSRLRMQPHEVSVFLFAKGPHVSLTKDLDEQDLRMSKVKQNVSSWFITESYTLAYYRISGYLQTMTNKGYKPLIPVQIALSDQ